MKYVFGGIAFLLFCWVFYLGFNWYEIAECRKWKAQSVEYPNYYLTQWQHDQCEAHKIYISSPVQ